MADVARWRSGGPGTGHGVPVKGCESLNTSCSPIDPVGLSVLMWSHFKDLRLRAPVWFTESPVDPSAGLSRKRASIRGPLRHRGRPWPAPRAPPRRRLRARPAVRVAPLGPDRALRDRERGESTGRWFTQLGGRRRWFTAGFSRLLLRGCGRRSRNAGGSHWRGLASLAPHLDHAFCQPIVI